MRLRSVAAALFCAVGLLAAPATVQAQKTTVTRTRLKNGGIPIPSGTVTITPVNAQGYPVGVGTADGDLYGPQGITGMIAAGAITGTYQVPDQCTAHAAVANTPLFYKIDLYNSAAKSTANPYGGYTSSIGSVQGICGASWALNTYAPTQAVTIAPTGLVTATSAPAHCTAPSIYYPTAGGRLSKCVSGVYVQDSAGGATLPATSALLKGDGAGGAAAAVAGDISAALGYTPAVAGAQSLLQQVSRATEYWSFGTSIATSTGATSTARGYASLLADWFSGGANPFGIGGSDAEDVSITLMQNYPIGITLDAPVVTIDNGMNSQHYRGTGASALANYASATLASLVQPAMPGADIFAAKAATLAGGFAVAQTGAANGIGVVASASGATVTQGFTTVAVNQPVYVGYLGVDGDAGTATVTLDGVQVGTLATQGPGGGTITTTLGSHVAMFGVRYVAATAGTHTLVITKSGASGTFTAIWTATANSAHLASLAKRVLIFDTPYEEAMNNATATDTYNAQLGTVVSQLVADKLPVVRAQTNTVFVNAVDMAGTPTVAADGTACPAVAGGWRGLHPNDCGHRKMAALAMSLIPAQPMSRPAQRFRPWIVTGGDYHMDAGDGIVFNNSGNTFLPTPSAKGRGEYTVYNYGGSAITVVKPGGATDSVASYTSATYAWYGGGYFRL